MKKISLLACLIFTLNYAQASCVDWHEVYTCENASVSLVAGQSWCGGRDQRFYQLSINKDAAREHLSQLARQDEASFRSLGLNETEQFGQFTFSLNPYVSGTVSENHADSSLKIELSLDSKKLGEYIFYNCNF